MRARISQISAGITLISLFFISGCSNKDRVPNGILSHKEMQAVVYDMMRADQFLSDFVLNKDSSLVKQDESIKMYKQVLAIHGLTHDELKKSMDYYRSHPALMKAVMDSISKIGTVEKTEPIPVTSADSGPKPLTDPPIQIEKPRTIIDTPSRAPYRKQTAPLD